MAVRYTHRLGSDPKHVLTGEALKRDQERAQEAHKWLMLGIEAQETLEMMRKAGVYKGSEESIQRLLPGEAIGVLNRLTKELQALGEPL